MTLLGRLVALTDSIGGRIDLTYDTLSRVVQEVTPRGVVAYTYDVLGRRTSMRANGQQLVTYTYNAASRLTQIVQGSLTVAMAYDAAGRRTTLTYSNGTTATSSYDTASRLTSSTHVGPSGIIEALTYQYDAAGNRTSLTRNNGAANLLPSAVTSATYDAANEQLSLNQSTPNATYDANGNLTSRTDGTVTTTYTWDARNRLTAITSPTLTASFVYDALNRRISKTVNGVTTQFLYDRKDVVQEIRNGAVTANYVRSLSIDEPFARVGPATEFYHRDALGTTLVLTDETGTAKTNYTYTPFGETTVTGTASTNPFQYAGRENDGTGLYHYRMRYYSPLMHRFIQEDPIGLTGGINMYAYVKNNPTRYTDPFGLDKKESKDEDYPWFWYLRCLIDPNCEPDVPPEFLPFIGGQVGGEAVNPGNLKKVSESQADKIAQQNGYKNAEHMKADNTKPGEGGKYNVSTDTSTGQIVLTPVKPGSAPNIPTGIFGNK